MGFFYDFGKKITEAGQGAIAKAKDFADIAKLNSGISEAEQNINSAYTEIGRLYYEVHQNDYEECFAEQFSTVRALSEKIQELEKQIIDVKGVVKCPNCGAEVPKTASFCAVCGSAIPVQPAAEEPVDQDVKKCPACGEIIKSGASFCMKCGAKIENAEPIADEQAPDEPVPEEPAADEKE